MAVQNLEYYSINATLSATAIVVIKLKNLKSNQRAQPLVDKVFIYGKAWNQISGSDPLSFIYNLKGDFAYRKCLSSFDYVV